MTQIIDGKYIIELDELTNIELVDWIPFQPNTVPEQAYRISLTNFIKALPIIPAVAGEYADIAEMLAAQPGQTVDVFYKVADPSDDPDYNDLKDSEIKSVYYHLVEEKTGSLSDYNSIAIPKLESSKFPKLGNSLEALTFDVKFRSAEWSSNKATLQAIANALKISSPQDLLLDALSLKLNTDNNPTDISRVLFGIDGQLIFEPIDSAKIQSDSDATDVTLNDAYQLLLTITGNQNVTNGLANIGLTAKSFSTASITAFAASGNNRVRATSAAHGFSEGDYVEIVNTANYDGIYEIKAVPNINDFDFTGAFVATETGDWEKSENREIAVDLRVNAISAKEFTRQIEGEGRLNFSEQLSGLVNGEDITVYVKSNTVGEAIEILGTSQSSELKIINSGLTEPSHWYVHSAPEGNDANDGSLEFPFETIQRAVDTAAEEDVIHIQDIYFSGGNVTVNKILSFIGPVASVGGTPFTELGGTWTIGTWLMFENIVFTAAIVSSVASRYLEFTSCVIDCPSTTNRNLGLLINGNTILDPSTLAEWDWIRGSGLTMDTTSGGSVTLTVSKDIRLDHSSLVDNNVTIVAGADGASQIKLYNSTIDGDVQVTGNLLKFNSVITGTETVSGTKTNRQAKIFDDSVEFKQNISANKIAAGIATALNAFGATEAAIGSGFAGISTAPTDGMIVEGRFGLGATVPSRKMHMADTGPIMRLSDTDAATDIAVTGFFEWFRGLTTNRVGFFGFSSASTNLLTFATDYTDAEIEFKTGDAVRAVLIDELQNACFGLSAPAAKVDIIGEDTKALPVLKLTQEDLSEEVIKFDATIAVGNPIEAVAAKTLTPTHFIKVNIEGVGVRYIQAGTIA